MNCAQAKQTESWAVSGFWGSFLLWIIHFTVVKMNLITFHDIEPVTSPNNWIVVTFVEHLYRHSPS